MREICLGHGGLPIAKIPWFLASKIGEIGEFQWKQAILAKKNPKKLKVRKLEIEKCDDITCKKYLKKK